MTTIQSLSIDQLVLEVADVAVAEAFYAEAFDLGDRLALRQSSAPTSGFRGFTLSLLVSQPSGVDRLIARAQSAGAKTLKPVKKSFWGYGGVVQAPDGTIWKVASSSKKNTGPETDDIDDVVLLIGAADVKASKRFYVEQGLPVAKSFGAKYVQFDAPDGAIKLALYGHAALAKDAGVPPEGDGSHRIVIAGGGPFTDPDGFAWEPATA